MVYPPLPLIIVVYPLLGQLGGSVLAKFVAEEGDGCALAGAAAMAAPLDYVAVDRHLASTWRGAFCDRCVIVPSVQRVLRHWPKEGVNHHERHWPKHRRGGGDASAVDGAQPSSAASSVAAASSSASSSSSSAAAAAAAAAGD